MRDINNIMSGLTQQRLGSNRIPQRVPAERRFVQRAPRNTSSTIQMGNSSHAAMKRIRIRRQAEEQRRRVEEQRRRAANIPLPKYVPPTTEEQTVKKAIPRRIVQSWIDRNLTPAIEKLCESHRKCNPGYEYVFYDDKECREFIEKHFHINVLHAYDAIIPGAFKADLFRYCELYINGGWWFDIDTMSVGSIDVAVAPEVEFACPRDGGITKEPALYQAILGAAKNQKFLAEAIKRILWNVARPEGELLRTLGPKHDQMFGITGPTMLAKCVRKTLQLPEQSKTNVWVDQPSIIFGNSFKHNGYCHLGNGVVAIGHPGLVIKHHHSQTQENIFVAIAKLRYRSKCQRYDHPVVKKKGSHIWPNHLSGTRSDIENILYQ